MLIYVENHLGDRTPPKRCTRKNLGEYISQVVVLVAQIRRQFGSHIDIFANTPPSLQMISGGTAGACATSGTGGCSNCTVPKKPFRCIYIYICIYIRGKL